MHVSLLQAGQPTDLVEKMLDMALSATRDLSQLQSFTEKS